MMSQFSTNEQSNDCKNVPSVSAPIKTDDDNSCDIEATTTTDNYKGSSLRRIGYESEVSDSKAQKRLANDSCKWPISSDNVKHGMSEAQNLAKCVKSLNELTIAKSPTTGDKNIESPSAAEFVVVPSTSGLQKSYYEITENRLQFIERYYNSRTRLPSSSPNAMSPLHISTPLNRLSECDEITRRLLSSPIRASSHLDRELDIDKSRRASVGTDPLTNQSSFETNTGDSDDLKNDNDILSRGSNVSPRNEMNVRSKHQQGRSLSVCHEEAQRRMCFKKIGQTKNDENMNNHDSHSTNLNRAVSVACDSSPSKQFLTIIPLFGCDIIALGQLIRFRFILPPPIDSAVNHLLTHGVKSVGIFRKSGVKSRILTLRQLIESNQGLKLEELNRENEFSIFDIADLVKMWFRELKPVPIMTKDLINIISDHIMFDEQALETSENQSESERIPSSQRLAESKIVDDRLKKKLISTISPTHKALLLKTLDFFSTIASHSGTNQMTSQNLAICLTPSLCATGSDQESIIKAQRALMFCIDNHKALF